MRVPHAAPPLIGSGERVRRHDPRHLLAPAWRVRIEPHEVPPRWRVERQVVKVCASDEQAARMSATRAAQIQAEVPPIRSLRAITFRHTSATPLGVTVR